MDELGNLGLSLEDGLVYAAGSWHGCDGGFKWWCGGLCYGTGCNTPACMNTSAAWNPCGYYANIPGSVVQ